jgi:hypothetical protein
MVYLELFSCAWSNPRERALHIRPSQDPDVVFVPTPDSPHEEHAVAALED